MATTEDMIAALADPDLQARVVAAAQLAGVASAEAWVQSNRARILTATIQDQPGVNTTIADVYAYALANYKPTPNPGANLAAVTDADLTAAIKTLNPTLA